MHVQVKRFLLFRMRTPSAYTDELVLAPTLRADIRHLRQAILREEGNVDIYKCPHVRDMRTTLEILKRRHTPIHDADPFTPEQLVQLIEHTKGTALVRIVIILSATGATRFIEAKRPESTIEYIIAATGWQLMVHPKGGRPMKLAMVPSTPLIDGYLQLSKTHPTSPIFPKGVTLVQLNQAIKTAAHKYGWRQGKWSSYSFGTGR